MAILLGPGRMYIDLWYQPKCSERTDHTKKLLLSLLKEAMMRAGGRENYAIKVIETAGQTLENILVKSDPFGGNKCDDKNCIPNKNPKNKISCRKNNVGYKIPCKLCPAAYLGETGENMHTRAKSHLTKFKSKIQQTREGSAFYKHIENKHGGLKPGEQFEDILTLKL